MNHRLPAVNPTLDKAWGYQGDNLNLPVGDLDAALPFYETVLGFRVASRSATPHRKRSGQLLEVGALAREYGFSDVDGTQPTPFRVSGTRQL